MKPDWDKLGDAYAGSSSVQILDVDCTVEKDLCSEFDVSGYPTIKYFKDAATEGASYEGGRDYDSLDSFVKETLLVLCDVEDPTECDEKEVKFIATMKEKGAEAVAKQLTRLEGMLSKPMKAELKGWVSKRISILSQLSKGKEEL